MRWPTFSHVMPSTSFLSFHLQIFMQRGIHAKRIHGIGHGIYIPIVHLDALGQNLGATGLFADNGRHSALHRLERGYSKRLRHGRHHIHIAVTETFEHLFPFHKTGKMTTVGYTVAAAISIMEFIISPLPAKQKRTLCVRSNTRLAASMKYSGPFCMVIRPKKVTTFSLRSE